MYYVYMLQCADASIYTGITTDIERRLKEHRSGRASHYTHSRGAVRMLYTERKRDRSTALRREAEIKKLTRVKKLALIRHAKAR